MGHRLLGVGLVVILALLVVICGGLYLLILHMPGASFQSTPSPLDSREETLRDRLKGHVRVLAEDIGERHYWRPDAKHRAADYIEQVFRDSGHEPQRQAVPTGDEVFHNIEVELQGRGDKDEILVIGAHYDTVRGSPGADDNASGVAVLMELARLLPKESPERTIRLVAFANEESPFFGTEAMGSLRYAREARVADENIVGMLSLEMLGYFTDEPGSQRRPPVLEYVYPDTGDFLAFVGNVASRSLVRETIGAFRKYAEVPSEGLAAPELIDDIRRSDHWAFWQQGYPGLMITDTANFRNPHYHGPDDTYDTLDYDTMARITAALAKAVAGMPAGR
ncbi:M20/M25/M40 family metallo-hydrolase [Aquisalimonas sp.]|uniref:M20/M25/M40 family metallo-hydrolase n=1 Tax=Aquisalimonas sp. TaxID=1872621 RepID=UPI0025BE7E52|nr:M20/M25/M40 family metallo-hydrolase [Aquisalimonas sp.]